MRCYSLITAFIGLASAFVLPALLSAADFAIVVALPTKSLRVDFRNVAGEVAKEDTWNDFTKKLFEFLDRDSDGILTAEEQKSIPPENLLRALWRGDLDNAVPRVNVANDAMQPNEKLPLEAFQQQIASLSLPELRTNADTKALSIPASHWLFTKLADGGERCTEASLKTVVERLRRLDVNDDECWSRAELLAAAKLEATVATEAGDLVEMSIRAEVKLPTKADKEAEAGQAIAVVDFAIRETEQSKSEIVFRNSPQTLASSFKPLSKSPDKQTTTLRYQDAAVVMVLHAVNGDGSEGFQAGQLDLTDQFDLDDLNGNHELELREMERSSRSELLQLLNKLCDRNGDNRLAKAELEAWLKLIDPAARRQLTFTIAQSGSRLFDALDQDGNQVLTLRELKSSWSQIADWDRNSDGRVAWQEVPLQVQFTASCGRPILNATHSEQIAQDVPNWFKNMDRNSDQDVSRREFLGPRNKFQQLDVDRDELLSPAEARAASKP